MTMTEMLNATIERREQLQAEDPKHQIWFCGEVFEIEGVGKVWCGIQIVQGVSTWMQPHFRRNWKLNGKSISAAKLQKIVGA